MAKRKTRTRNADVSKREITQAAIRVFARKGFANASFQEIADEVGLSQAAVFYHFENREKLVQSALTYVTEHNHETVSALAKATDSAEDRLIQYGLGNMKWGVDNPEEAQVLLLVFYLSTCNPDVSELSIGMLQTGRKRIEEILHAGIREKAFGLTTQEVPEAAVHIHDAFAGAFVNVMTGLRAGRTAARRVLEEFEPRWRRVVFHWTHPPQKKRTTKRSVN